MKRSWLMIVPVIVFIYGCGAPTSISSSISCTGNTLINNSSYKVVASKKRANMLKSSLKSYHKKKRVYKST